MVEHEEWREIAIIINAAIIIKRNNHQVKNPKYYKYFHRTNQIDSNLYSQATLPRNNAPEKYILIEIWKEKMLIISNRARLITSAEKLTPAIDAVGLDFRGAAFARFKRSEKKPLP